MNSAGGTIPRAGWGHLNSASQRSGHILSFQIEERLIVKLERLGLQGVA